MPTVTDAVVIHQPAAEVFRYAADVRTFAEWGTGVLSAAQDRGDQPGAGAAYTVRRRVGSRTFDVKITIVEFQPNERLVLRGASNEMPWTSEMTFTPSGGGTRVSESIRLQPSGIAKLFSPILSVLVRRTHRRDLDGLRERLDSKA